jgi:ABC-type transport system substrate-binding protein
VLTFGQLPEGSSPFLDERVRQAVSMSWDRNGWIDVFNNVSKFEAEGLPVDTRWNSHIIADWYVDGSWLDPRGKDFGPNAKYFLHDIAEAKRLLAAAGFSDGLDVKSHYVTGPQLSIGRTAEPLDGFTNDAGFRVTIEPIDYAKDYIPNYRDGQGQYDGWAWHTVSGTTPIRISPVSALAAEYWSNTPVTFKGFSVSGKNDKSGDPQLNSIIAKARLERDAQKRRALVHEGQRYLGKAMYGLIMPGGANGFTMAWPALQNFRVWRGPHAWNAYRLWIDETKPPFTNG